MDRKNVQKAAADHAEWRRTVRVDVAILYEQILADAQQAHMCDLDKGTVLHPSRKGNMDSQRQI